MKQRNPKEKRTTNMDDQSEVQNSFTKQRNELPFDGLQSSSGLKVHFHRCQQFFFYSF